MNSKKPFDPNKPVVTASGWAARILCKDLDGLNREKPILAAVRNEGCREVILSYFPDGKLHADRASQLDLVNVPEETREFWNLYERTHLSYPDKSRGFETASLPSARHKTLGAALKAGNPTSSLAVLEVVRVDGEVVDMILHKREKK